MLPEQRNGNITARCPDCEGAITNFEFAPGGRELGTYFIDGAHQYMNKGFVRVMYRFYRCTGCGRSGMAKIHDTGNTIGAVMEWFVPTAVDKAPLPVNLPAGIQTEFREAELCFSVGACRAASGLLRSTLEKLLIANGYTKGSLAARIDEVAADGVITESRRKKAHEDVRVLGNDVLHDEWREVAPEEVEAAHRYVQRVTEDLYDDRAAVECILRAKNRLV